MRRRALALPTALGLALASAAGAAPPAADKAAPTPRPTEKLREIVVKAIRNCPEGEEGEIVVCAPDRGVAEAYRLPRLDPRYAGAEKAGPPDPSGEGRTLATGNCSASGSAGATGCALAEANGWGAWKRREQERGERWFPW